MSDHTGDIGSSLAHSIYSAPNNNSETVYVIGGAGFIGSVVTTKLLRQNYKVVVADNLFKGGRSLLGLVGDPNFSFVKCDITNRTEVKELFKKQPDHVILLSGIVGLSQCNNSRAMSYAVNVDGWYNVVDACKAPITSAGTGSVYGKVDGLCTEKTPTNPLSIYGTSKLLGEEIVLETGGTSIRYATCAGVSPNMRLNLLPNQLAYEAVMNRCINLFQPHAKRTFIDIRDFADSLIFFMRNKNNLKHSIYNCGDEANNLTKLELATLIQNKTGCHINIVDTFTDPDERDYSVSYSRLKETGFKTKYTMDQTIDNLLKSIPLLATWD